MLSTELADRYFSDLQNHCQWEQKPGIFGHMQPGLIASYGDTGATYRYSGVDNPALPWIDTLLKIKQKIEAVQREYNLTGVQLLSCHSRSLGCRQYGLARRQ